ncbi:MAG: hypothetical protein ACJA1M_000437 [Alphaproteobacteria bacterium]|jgi:hypothetical protein
MFLNIGLEIQLTPVTARLDVVKQSSPALTFLLSIVFLDCFACQGRTRNDDSCGMWSIQNPTPRIAPLKSPPSLGEGWVGDITQKNRHSESLPSQARQSRIYNVSLYLLQSYCVFTRLDVPKYWARNSAW